MARLTHWLHRGVHALQDLLPDSLFGRLALLLVAVAIASHVLALSLLFELRPAPEDSGTALPLPPAFGMPLHGPHAPSEPHGPPLGGILLDIGVRLSAVVLAAWIGARWLAAPMHRLAQATKELAGNIHRSPISPQGTRECREATGMINQLQAHILTQLEERDQFIAAVSHDLRTPLTRLALRVESLQSAQDRQRLGRDIVEMDQMIRATLDYLSGSAEAEPWVDLDLGSLVECLVQDSQDCGDPVCLSGGNVSLTDILPIKAQLSAIRRCITNVLDNAVRYGGGAQISVQRQGNTLCVCITDRGPGIPPEALEKVLRPFYRLEASRNRHTGGVGLGLASAHDIVKRHGGTIHLDNRAGGGLQVELRFPANT
jgi:protein-histidine pros-kinase